MDPLPSGVAEGHVHFLITCSESTFDLDPARFFSSPRAGYGARGRRRVYNGPRR